jgi:divinyl protochlorophyllide a 8-vinyl-reductase
MAAAASRAGLIGPNAIIRVAESLPARVGLPQTRALFEHAGLLRYLLHPPQDMVPESEVRALHGVLRHELGVPLAREVALEAGQRTAAYLLAHRIPKPVQALLKVLPAALAARVLLAAITRNAWTFVGSGRFSASAGSPVQLTIQHNPLCVGVLSDTPACDFYAATFEALFRALVHARATVVEVECESCGASACRFEIQW